MAGCTTVAPSIRATDCIPLSPLIGKTAVVLPPVKDPADLTPRARSIIESILDAQGVKMKVWQNPAELPLHEIAIKLAGRTEAGSAWISLQATSVMTKSLVRGVSRTFFFQIHEEYGYSTESVDLSRLTLLALNEAAAQAAYALVCQELPVVATVKADYYAERGRHRVRMPSYTYYVFPPAIVIGGGGIHTGGVPPTVIPPYGEPVRRRR